MRPLSGAASTTSCDIMMHLRRTASGTGISVEDLGNVRVHNQIVGRIARPIRRRVASCRGLEARPMDGFITTTPRPACGHRCMATNTYRQIGRPTSRFTGGGASRSVARRLPMPAPDG